MSIIICDFSWRAVTSSVIQDFVLGPIESFWWSGRGKIVATDTAVTSSDVTTLFQTYRVSSCKRKIYLFRQ